MHNALLIELPHIFEPLAMNQKHLIESDDNNKSNKKYTQSIISDSFGGILSSKIKRIICILLLTPFFSYF